MCQCFLLTEVFVLRCVETVDVGERRCDDCDQRLGRTICQRIVSCRDGDGNDRVDIDCERSDRLCRVNTAYAQLAKLQHAGEEKKLNLRKTVKKKSFIF